MSKAAEKAALEHLAGHKELGLEYGDSAHIGIFLAGAKWGRQEERYMPEQRSRIDGMLDEVVMESLKEAIAEVEAERKEEK